MKSIIFSSCLLLTLTALISRGTDIPKSYQVDGYKLFSSLKTEDAVLFGQKMAGGDFSNSLYRFFTYGEPGPTRPSEEYLRKTYAIYSVPIAGCKVTDGILGVAKGYNETMRKLLEDHFEKDVVAEAAKKAAEQDAAANP